MALVAGQVLAGPGAAAPASAADRPDPNVGPGGPVLVVTAGTFGSYLLEIMRGEGLNLFTAGTTSNLTAGGLSSYKTVVLGTTKDTSNLTADQVTALTNWVNGGGNLIAMRPESQLSGLLGLTAATGTVSEGYIDVDTSTAAGAGIVGDTMQFHGTADRYTANSGTQTIATLYTSATASANNPAVTLRSVGSSGGSAAAFTYDLAQSVVLTRQGNPALKDQNTDGQDGPNRSDDLFFPDYVNLDKVAIPQADEQQRLLANLIIQNTSDTLPIPRFWYLPRMAKAAVVMTADNHNPDYNHGAGVQTRFDYEYQQTGSTCSVANWDCVRSTSYFYPANDSLGTTQTSPSTYQSEGFELAVHVTTSDTNGVICKNVSQSQYATQLDAQLTAFRAWGLAAPVTNRNHCIAWMGYTGVPEEEVKQGIHLDTNYYYWPDTWVQDRPGMFTGSGFPQRFSTTGGQLLDIYQAPTQMTDESGQTYPYTAATLLDAAINNGYYGTFVANIHTDGPTEDDNHDIIAAARARGVPVISAKQLLTWIDGRNASSFTNLSMSGSTLTFKIAADSGANGLYAMLPVQGPGGTLQSLTSGGSTVSHSLVTIKGIQYWTFAASDGSSYAATYGTDTTRPTLTSTVPVSGATGVAVGSAVSATFSESVASSSASAVTMRASGAGSDVGATATVNGATVTLKPSSSLSPNTTYTVSVSTGVADLAGNHLAAATSWSFTTGNGTLAAGTPVIGDTTPAVGDVLTVDEGNWSPTPAFTYQWLRDGSSVVGTAETYPVTSSDLSHTLSVKVTGTLAGYNTTSATSAATSAVQLGTLTAGTPTITGDPGIGLTLAADEGTWGPTPVAYTYRWLRGSSAISGATGSTYVVSDGDVGSTLSVEVTGSKTGYTSATRTSSPTVKVQKYSFTSEGTPTISGDAVVGKVLTANENEGAWNPTPTSFAYQWLRAGVKIDGATGKTYTLTAGDLGSTLSVQVTGSKTDYTDVSRTSAPTAVVAAGALTPGTPTISGDAEIGKVLTVATGDWGPAPVDLARQWLRGSSAISGATGDTYTVTSADAGSTLAVRVTGTKTGYTTVSVTSAATATVPSVPVTPTPASPNPTVSGVPRVGMPLTAVLGTWSPVPTKVTYQWYRLKSSGARVAIKKATAAVYTPTSSVKGKQLEVRIRALVGQTTLTRYSARTAKVGSPMTAKTPKISDTTPAVGQVLTAKVGSWKPAQTIFTYQWYARNSKGTVTLIPGATGSTYQVAAGYASYKLKVKVTGSASTYKSVTRTSKYTHKVK